MKTAVLIAAAILFSLSAVADRVEAATYVFNVSNVTVPPNATYCNQLDILIINNGQQVASASSKNPLSPNQPVEQIQLKADYCTKIQLKTVCSGQSNFHEKTCSGGTVMITSATEMNY